MQHKDLSVTSWSDLPLVEQLANIGSEVIRAMKWRKKGNAAYATLAFYRALELTDLTLATSLTPSARHEIARVRSALVDDFSGNNSFGSTDECWMRYFMAFTFAANRTT